MWLIEKRNQKIKVWFQVVRYSLFISIFIFATYFDALCPHKFEWRYKSLDLFSDLFITQEIEKLRDAKKKLGM